MDCDWRSAAADIEAWAASDTAIADHSADIAEPAPVVALAVAADIEAAAETS